MTSRKLKFRQENRKTVRRFWTGIMVFIPLILLWVNQTVNSTKILYQIQKVEEELKHEHDKKIALEMLKDRMTSLEFVEWTARNKLGFVEPKAADIVVLPAL